MTAKTADILRALVHGKTYGYKMWLTTWCESHFGRIISVNKCKVSLMNDKGSISNIGISVVETAEPFYGGTDISDLEDGYDDEVVERVIHYRDTLIYYDGERLFTASDESGVMYMCVEVEEDPHIYMCAVVTEEEVATFNSDLRLSVFYRESEVLYQTTSVSFGINGCTIIRIDKDTIDPEWYPTD